MSLIAADTSTVMLALGLALLVTILLRRSFRYLGRTSRRPASALEKVARPRASSRQALDDAPPELLRWQVEMHETARDLKAELDTKIAVVRQLLLMVTEQQERIERSIAKAEHLGLARCRDTLSEIKNATTPSAGPANQQIPSDRLGCLPPTSTESQGQLTDRRQAVSRLADLGTSSAAIANQLSLSVGEVEMLLRLRSHP